MKPQTIGIFAIITVMSAYFIISDWQAIPFDPCTNCSPYHHPNLLKNISGCVDQDEDLVLGTNHFLSAASELRINSEFSLQSIHNISSSSVLYDKSMLLDEDYLLFANKCANASLPHHNCHWIPFSLIANKDCEDCPPICRSTEQTLSFPQFVVGMALLIGSNPLVWFPMVAIISNQTPLPMQVYYYSNKINVS